MSGGEDRAHRQGHSSGDPAASMSLLRQVFEDPLTGAYRRTARHTGPLPLWRRALILAFAVALGLGTGVAVRGLRAPDRQIEAASQGLHEQVNARTQRVRDLQSEVRALRTRLNDADAEASPAPGEDSATRLAAGTGAAGGAGVAVSLDDAKGADAGNEDASDGLVRDADIRYVLNALWRAGAEAIAVEGVRIGSDVSVRQAGQTILVDLQVAQPPYRIEAIGDPSALQAALAQGEAGDYLSTLHSAFGIGVDVSRQASLSLPAQAHVSADHATPVGGGGGS